MTDEHERLVEDAAAALVLAGMVDSAAPADLAEPELEAEP